MTNNIVLDFLASLFYYSSSILNLTPLNFSKNQNQEWVVNRIKIRTSTKVFWCLILLISFITSIIELHFSLYTTGSVELINVLYHTFEVIVKAAVSSLVYMYNIKSAEISCFLNCLCKWSSSLEQSLYRNSKLLQVLAFFTAILVYIFFIVLILLVSLSQSCLHKTLTFNLFSSCNSISFKLYLLLMKLIFIVPVLAMTPIGTTSTLLTLEEINSALKRLRCVSKYSKALNKTSYIQYVGRLYRQVQILVILSNKAFQAFLWPAVQFYSAIALITLLYPLIRFNQKLGIFGMVLICVVIVAVLVTCFFMLGMGRKIIIHSNKILRDIKDSSDCSWTRKFFQSCPTISIRVGEFHKMDNERIPAFIRFVLQRTFFLVLKTKLKKGSGVDMGMTF